MSGSPEVPRDEVAAALAARRELGADMEPEVVDSLVDRIDRVIDAKVAAKLAERGADRNRGAEGSAAYIALGSIGLGIPVTAIAGGIAGLPGILITWIGIAIVNVAYIIGIRR